MRSYPFEQRSKPLIVSFLTGFFVACSGTDPSFVRAKAAGDRALEGGRYEQAARAYHQAATVASRPHDQHEGLFLEADAYQKAGEVSKALEVYQKLASLPPYRGSPGGDRTARAAYERAWLEIDHGDAKAGWAALEQALSAYPDGGSARRALRKLLEHYESEGGPSAGRAWLEKNLTRLSATELGEDAHYLIAHRLEAEGHPREAREAFVACAKRYPYPDGSLFDDAWWNASLLDERLGDPQAAVEDLRQLLEHRETSTLSQGSYERPRYSPAQFRIAELYRDKFHDTAQARGQFHKLYTDFRTSRLRADALWQEALLARKDNDPQSVCSLVTTLVREFPESRYAGCAPLLCERAQGVQGGLCHGYIRAQIETTTFRTESPE